MNGSDCPTPIYVATMSRTETLIGTVTSTGTRSVYKTDQREFTLVSLLEVARKTHGMDVTIHNVRWDVKNGKKKTGCIRKTIRVGDLNNKDNEESNNLFNLTLYFIKL